MIDEMGEMPKDLRSLKAGHGHRPKAGSQQCQADEQTEHRKVDMQDSNFQRMKRPDPRDLDLSGQDGADDEYPRDDPLRRAAQQKGIQARDGQPAAEE